MSNPYRRLMKIAMEENVGSEELLRALMASVFSESCDCCNQKFHSREFADGFRHLIREIRFCRGLSRRRSALRWKQSAEFLYSLKQFARKTFLNTPTPKAEVKVEHS